MLFTDLPSDIHFYLQQFLDLGDIIRLKRAYGEPIPNRRYIRSQVRRYIKDKNERGLASLLREEKGFEQYARLHYLTLCMKQSSYLCYIVLYNHFKRYKFKKQIPYREPTVNDSLDTFECKHFIRLLYDEGLINYFNSTIAYILFPYSVDSITKEQLENNLETYGHIYGDELSRKIQAYMKREFTRRRSRNHWSSSGGLYNWSLMEHKIYISRDDPQL